MDETDELELYYSYKVQEGDTLESIIQQFTEKKLVHTQNYIIDKNLSVQQVWNDEANKSPGHICHTGFSKREGKNAEECRVYPGEWVALPYEGFLCTPPIGDPKEQKKLRGCAEPKKKDAQVPEVLWVHGKQKVKIIPIMFLPGIMGTRLRNSETKKTIWDPDDSFYMIELSKKEISEKQKLLGISNTPDAEPITDPNKILGIFPKPYAAERRERGYASVASGFYEKFLKTLETKLNNPEVPQGAQDTEIIYPVYVCPYDWRKDITDIAGKEVKDVYDTIKKDQGTDEIIIITHSMGGLVARDFLRQNEQAAKKIRGVIHGVQPAAGAVQFYAYFKCGARHFRPWWHIPKVVLGNILGATKKDFAALCCDIPGAIELAPTDKLGEYQWLDWDAELEQKYGIEVQKDKIFSCYEDKSGILGLTAPDFDKTVKKLITGNIKKAKSFHENLKSECHKRTYALSSAQVQTVQSVRIVQNKITADFVINFYDSNSKADRHLKAKGLTCDQKKLLYGLKTRIARELSDARKSKGQDGYEEAVKAVEERLKERCKEFWNFQDPRVQIEVTQTEDGDGTVPLKSQQALDTVGSITYAQKEHSKFYTDDQVIDHVIEYIKKLSAEKDEEDTHEQT